MEQYGWQIQSAFAFGAEIHAIVDNSKSIEHVNIHLQNLNHKIVIPIFLSS